MRGVCLLGGFFFATALWAIEDVDRQQIEQRLAPVGHVRVEGAHTSATKEVTPPDDTPVKAITKGQAIYQKYCSLCHQNGLAGAPKYRNTADWEPRLKAKKLEGLVQSVSQGLNAMPPKGTCTECSEDDFKQAIQYMLPQ